MNGHCVLNARLHSGRSKKDGRIKVGHGGTLDKDAEGVLVLGIGKGTTMLTRYLQGDKVCNIVYCEPPIFSWAFFHALVLWLFSIPARYMHVELEKESRE
jgi:hypothetical protein